MVLSITLVGAEYPVNLGYTARLMKNFGLNKLYLVDPNCDMRAASVYASHGAEVIEGAEVTSLAKVRSIHDLLLGTTAIRATRGANVGRTAVKPEDAIQLALTARSASLVFGRDTTGLTNQELALCDLVTTVETGTGYKTLNVSHSVAILLYVAWKSSRRTPGPRTIESRATKERREAFAKYAYGLAMATGMQKHRADRVIQVAKRVALKSEVSSKELGLLVSLMRRAEFVVKEQARRVPRRRRPS